MEKKGERTKKEICRAAGELFAVRGYKDVSMQDVEAGCSAVQALENLLKIYRDDMEMCRESLAFALFEYATTSEENMLDSRNTADREYWHRLVEYGVQTGEFNDVNPDVVMDSFLYSYRGMQMWGRVLLFDKETFDHITEAVRFLLIKNYRGKEA